MILVGKDVEPRIGLLVNHAFADKGIGIITWLSFGSDVGKLTFLVFIPNVVILFFSSS